MEVENIIHKRKEIFSSLIDFINNTQNSEIESLINVFEKHEILKDSEEVKSTLQLVSKIADNHQRLPGFIDKIGQIIQYLNQAKDSRLSDSDLFNTFIKNKRILLLLLEQGFVQPDNIILSNIMHSEDRHNFPYRHYLYSGIKPFITEFQIKSIEDEIKKEYKEEINNFVEKCRIGENDSYICSLIRQDSVEEFISYVNKNNISLSSQIKPSIFETNLFLIEKNLSLIKYATFFGSIQIIRYLRYNNVSLTNVLWLYAIHSNKPEMIHFLEENEVQLEKDMCMIFFGIKDKYSITYHSIYDESIKCYHNDIADYIKNNYLGQTQDDNMSFTRKLLDINHDDSYSDIIIDSNNYYFYPNDIGSVISESKSMNCFHLRNLCFSLRQITIPSSVTSIGQCAFAGCDLLTQITIPSSVTSIGQCAFNGCESLTQITIPSSVILIGNRAFAYCSSLTQITIPSSVTKIKNEAFHACSSLKQVIFSNPSNITEIERFTFDGCLSLTQITIPSSVTKIEHFAFYKCSLKQISIPSSVTKIEDNVFKECASLEKITLPSSIKEIGEESFRGCSSLTQISIPSSVTSIGNYAFDGCSSLTQISIPSSVTSIGNGAFKGCSSLMKISIPSSVTSIGDNVFFGCSSLISISIPSSLYSDKLGIPYEPYVIMI